MTVDRVASRNIESSKLQGGPIPPAHSTSIRMLTQRRTGQCGGLINFAHFPAELQLFIL
jgi:hypothetical protein